MRNISFSMTLEQFRNRTKFVTRRIGWIDLPQRSLLHAVEKAQGLKQGEKIRKLDQIAVFFVRRERLDAITKEDVVLEGFPEMSAEEFIELFCRMNRCAPETIVTRIEFGYWLDEGRNTICLVDVKGKTIKTEIIDARKMITIK